MIQTGSDPLRALQCPWGRPGATGFTGIRMRPFTLGVEPPTSRRPEGRCWGGALEAGGAGAILLASGRVVRGRAHNKDQK